MSDDWTLTDEQYNFIAQRHNIVIDAYDCDDMDTLRDIEALPEFANLFGDMCWDEAFDRYECMNEEDAK